MPFDGRNIETVASKMKRLFGQNGERWTCGITVEGEKMCLIGAAAIATGNDIQNIPDAIYDIPRQVIEILRAAVMHCRAQTDTTYSDTLEIKYYSPFTSISSWNDHASTDFLAVTRCLDKMHELEIKQMVDAAADQD